MGRIADPSIKLTRAARVAGKVLPLPPDPEAPLSTAEFVSKLRAYHNCLKELLPCQNASPLRRLGFVHSYSDTVDSVVNVVFGRSSFENGVEPGQAGIAVIGMGGYGRRELAPFSDVDILLLCRRKTSLVKKVAGSFVRTMWDVGFEIGHSVQSLVESEGVFARNMDMRTALLESRLICGSKEIFAVALRQMERVSGKDKELFINRKVMDAMKRHARYGGSYQLVEPNVKLSPGGLRDYQTLLWLGMVSGRDRSPGLSALRKGGLLHRGEKEALEAAYDFLQRTRVELHLASRSKQDQLTVRMQRLVAPRLGYGSRGDHLGVELFMKDYYMHTRTVYQILLDVIGDLESGGSAERVLAGRGRVRRSDRLHVLLDRKRLERDPLYVFRLQKERGLELDRALKGRLRTFLSRHPSERKWLSRMRRGFGELMKSEGNLSLVLRAMQETGFLGKVIPEYDRLTCLKRYDLYHSYTADEHSFRVIAILEELSTVKKGRLSPLARIYSEVPDKEVLLLAALLHDVGKIQGRGHARKGAALSPRILRRIGYDENTIAGVCFLIEHHLLMSHFSQRRDPTEIGTLESFCRRVRNRTNLKYLVLLTYADLKATSVHAWSRWKYTLLWGLYIKANQFMAKKEKKPEAAYKSRKSAILRSFPAGPERKKALNHLDLLPGRYLLTMSPSQVKSHLDLVDRLDGKKGVVSMRRRKNSIEITFCTIDKPFRLSELCGVLTVNDFNILSAFAFTRNDGKVIDVFEVESIGDAPVDGAKVNAVQEELDGVLAGRVDIEGRFREHVARWKRMKKSDIPVPLRIEFDSDISPDFTIVDVFAKDEPGLLYRITRALSKAGLAIYRARISTEANRAIDGFYVKDRKGNKIASAARLRRIRGKLEAALSSNEPS